MVRNRWRAAPCSCETEKRWSLFLSEFLWAKSISSSAHCVTSAPAVCQCAPRHFKCVPTVPQPRYAPRGCHGNASVLRCKDPNDPSQKRHRELGLLWSMALTHTSRFPGSLRLVSAGDSRITICSRLQQSSRDFPLPPQEERVPVVDVPQA